MYTPLNNLPGSAKVWIYQSPKKFTQTEKEIINRRLAAFTETWMVHGAALKASFEVVYDQFVILAADDVASGCSIDSSVKIMREIASELGIDFFDRTSIGFLVENEVRLIPLGSLKTAFADKHLGAETPVFNNAIALLREFRESWPAPARNTWVSRYFPKESVEK